MRELLVPLTLVVAACGSGGGETREIDLSQLVDAVATTTTEAELDPGDDVGRASAEPTITPEPTTTTTSTTTSTTTTSVAPEMTLADAAEECVAATGGDISQDTLADVLTCFDEIRRRQPAPDAGEVARLRSQCNEVGGDACTELVLRSGDENDHVLGLSCGGRAAAIPCPAGPPPTTTTTTTTTTTQPPLQSQEISIVARPAEIGVGETSTIEVSATSGLPVQLQLEPGSCSGQGFTVVGLRPGVCTVIAEQPGGLGWAPASAASVEITVVAPPVNECGGVAPANWGPVSYNATFHLPGTFQGDPACLVLQRIERCRFSGCFKDDLAVTLYSATTWGCWHSDVEMIGNDGGLTLPEVPISSGYGDDLTTHRFDCQTTADLPGYGPRTYIRLEPGGRVTLQIGPFQDVPWSGTFG